MVALIRQCRANSTGGARCNATPIRDADWCWWHHPAHQQEVAEARRLGGVRRKREDMIEGAFEFEGLGTVRDLRRLLDVAAVDARGMENSNARAQAVDIGRCRTSEASGEDRLAALEEAMQPGGPGR